MDCGPSRMTILIWWRSSIDAKASQDEPGDGIVVWQQAIVNVTFNAIWTRWSWYEG